MTTDVLARPGARGDARRRLRAAGSVALTAVAAMLSVATACGPHRGDGVAGKGAAGVTDDVVARVETLSPEDQLTFLRGLEEKGRHDTVVYFHMGNSYYTLEELDSAIVYYGHAIAADSSYTKAWVNMGLAYDSQHQVEASRRAFEEALAVNPKDVLALCHLGFSYFTGGQEDVAMKYYLDALAVDPNSAQAHYNLGLAFADAKLFGEALTEWKKVVELDPDSELGRTAAENVGLIKTYLEFDE